MSSQSPSHQRPGFIAVSHAPSTLDDMAPTLSLMKLRHLTRFLFCLLILLMGVWAWHLKDPRLILVRHIEGPVLLAVAVMAGTWTCTHHRGLLRILSLWGVSATLALTLVSEGSYEYRKQWVLSQPPEVLALAPHFIVGYRDPLVLHELAAKGLIGGVFVTRRNVQGKSIEALQSEIAELQALRQQAGLPALLISTDQEGGAVSRMSPPLPRQDSLATLTRNTSDGTALVATAYQHGRTQGRDLAALGVNVNFSPVVDLKVDHGPNRLDFYSLISTRAISADPQQTALVAQAYSLGLQSQGVTPTLKHFPGMGDVRDDTHFFSATLDTPVPTLRERDWLPFRQVARNTQALIMLGHVVVPDIDPQAPASLSGPLIQKVIRGEWQHNGPLVTDDLTMAAAYNRGFCELIPQALNAGVDLLLISFDEEKYIDAMYCAAQAKRHNKLDNSLLAQSAVRLKTLTDRWATTARTTPPRTNVDAKVGHERQVLNGQRSSGP